MGCGSVGFFLLFPTDRRSAASSAFRITKESGRRMGSEQPLVPNSVESSPTAGGVSDGGHRVLVVDDNRDGAESLAMLLTMELDSCVVETVFDGLQALAVLDSFAPDIALLDIGMPGMDGYELARRIRATHRGRELTLIALTGWGQADDKQRAAEAGFDEHLTKPVDPELLARVISCKRSAAA
jgi:CheY-like chemotaxis protein